MDVFRPNDTFIWSCQHSPSQYVSRLRVIIVALGGSSICLMSFIANALIIYVFQTSLRLRRQNYANPVILAIFDMLVPLCFLLIVAVPMLAYYNEWDSWFHAWIFYVKAAYLFRHFCESMCNFLLLMASIERLLGYNPEGNQGKALVFFVRYRSYIFVVMVFLSMLLKGTLLFETSILEVPHCHTMDTYVPIQVNYMDQFSVFRFWCRKIMSVILPFVGLVYCNWRIVEKYIQKKRMNAEQSIRQKAFDVKSAISEETYLRFCQDKKGAKSATLTLIMVVACYTVTNSVSLGVSVLEFFRLSVIQNNYHSFLLITDFSWLLTIAGCAFRIFIYIFSDQKMKKALARAIFRFRVRALPSKDLQLEQHQLDKLSMQGVSNSLRSNLTNANGEAPLKRPQKRRMKDELGSMVHLRGNIVVNVTMRLGSLVSQNDRDQETREDWLTDIQEEESHYSRRDSRYRSICADTRLLSTEEMDETEPADV